MIKFIVKRLLALIPVLIGVTLLVYFILDLAPGDPAKTILGEQARPEDIAALREEMGLDDPFFVRYGRYMWDLVHGDFGTSYKTRDPVSEEILARFPNTIKLTLTSTVADRYIHARLLDGPLTDPSVLRKTWMVPCFRRGSRHQELSLALVCAGLHAHGVHRPYDTKLHA